MKRNDQNTLVTAILMQYYLKVDSIKIPEEILEKALEDDIVGVEHKKHDDGLELKLIKKSDLNAIDILQSILDDLKELAEEKD